MQDPIKQTIDCRFAAEAWLVGAINSTYTDQPGGPPMQHGSRALVVYTLPDDGRLGIMAQGDLSRAQILEMLLAAAQSVIATPDPEVRPVAGVDISRYIGSEGGGAPVARPVDEDDGHHD